MAKCYFELVLLGDSDVAFWPSILYPSTVQVSSSRGRHRNEINGEGDMDCHDTSSSISMSTPAPPHLNKSSQYEIQVIEKIGIPGSTLSGIVDQLPKVFERLKVREGADRDCVADSIVPSTTMMHIFVICAGENDTGNCIPLDETIGSLHELLPKIFGQTLCNNLSTSSSSLCSSDNAAATWESSTINSASTLVIFLGPKFEPWMDETSDSLLWKKKYSAMSRAMERCCNELNSRLNNNSNKVRSKQIRFVDCLTMFCGESAEQPGAVFGGRAKAEHQYFASDGLHLNDEGYQVWKDRIEHIIYDYFLLVQRQCCGK